MSVITMWQCDRDGSIFSDKKSAEEYEKLLELASNITLWLKNTFSTLDHELAENIGLLIAENKETLIKAFKGKVDVIDQLIAPDKSKKVLENDELPLESTITAKEEEPSTCS